MSNQSERSTLYRNCRLAFPDYMAEGALLSTGDQIAAIWIDEQPARLPAGTQEVDCQGLILAPGLVDIHNHGALTQDFVAADAAGNNIALRFHAEHGVTSMLATVMTETHEQMCAALKLLGDQHEARELFPNFLGIHVEGPYFHADKRGAHRLDCLRDADRAEYEKFWEQSRHLIRIFTHAPDRGGSLEFCRFFHERGCVPAIGHTRATMLEVRRAAAHGARHFVHANNAIDWPVRKQNAAGWNGTELMGMGAMLSHSVFTSEIIADGYHVPVEMMRIILAARGTDAIALVSDACPAAGCPPGQYQQGGLPIEVRENRLVISGAGNIDGVASLGGSGTPLLLMIRNFVGWGFGLSTALKMSTTVPARIIGETRRGMLRVGNHADLILIDDQVNLFGTVVSGKIVYRHKRSPLPVD